MTDIAYAWAPITKAEEQPDGTLMVYGPATDAGIDRDRQRMNQEFLDRAMPAWMAEGGNVREQHDPRRAVGVGVGLSKGADGAYLLTSCVVDPVAIKKVKAGVLKGYSIGIKDPKLVFGKADAPNGEIVDGDVIEVSLVDRPANPRTLFTMAKADGAGDLQPVDEPHIAEVPDEPPLPEIRSKADLRKAIRAVEDVDDDTERVRDHILTRAEALGLQAMVPAQWTAADVPDTTKAQKYTAAQLKEMAGDGRAMADGSYPIDDRDDLEKAIKAVGRGGADHDAIRKHVIARAKALKLADLIPDNWNSDGSLKTTAKADETGQEATMPELSKADAEAVSTGERLLAELAELGLSKADSAAAPADGDSEGGSGDDDAGDIAGAQDAIARIAALIISEAQSLAAGNLSEAYDISCLLEAVAALKYFICREQNEAVEETLMLADTPDDTATSPDMTKADDVEGETAPDADEVVKTDTQTHGDTPETPEYLTKADIADLVKASIAEATTAYEERISQLEESKKSLEADLAKALAQPQPGGPVLTRTAAQHVAARNTDADQLRTQAQELLTKAQSLAHEDSTLAVGYRERAQALLAKAEA